MTYGVVEWQVGWCCQQKISCLALEICKQVFKGSKGEATDQDTLAPDFPPPSTPNFSGEVGLNLALGLVNPVSVLRLHVGGRMLLVRVRFW